MLIPGTWQELSLLAVEQIDTLITELETRDLDAENIERWLLDCDALGVLFQEWMARLEVAIEQDTADRSRQERLNAFRRDIFPLLRRFYQAIGTRRREHLQLLPPAIRQLVEREQTRENLNTTEDSLLLLNRESELLGQFFNIIGAHTVIVDDQQMTMRQLRRLQMRSDRVFREQVWRAGQARMLQDREECNEIWKELLQTRVQMAQINGFDNYFTYLALERGKFASIEDCITMHAAVEQHVIPALQKIREKRREQLGVEQLRPWDLLVDPQGRAALVPFVNADDLLARTSQLFHRMHPTLGAHFDRLYQDGLLDLENRPNKGPAGGFARAIGRSGIFIFMNLTGIRWEIDAFLHEIGHAFAMIEGMRRHPYLIQAFLPQEFSETPSTVMEMLSMPYRDAFFSGEDLIRARHEYFEECLSAIAFDALLDAFQIAVYLNPVQAVDPAWCDEKWAECVKRFQPVVDYSGLENELRAGWQTSYSSYYMPLHALEYIYGRVAGMRMWAKVKQDPRAAIEQYIHAIGLGATVPIKDLFAALDTPFPITSEGMEATVHNILAAL